MIKMSLRLLTARKKHNNPSLITVAAIEMHLFILVFVIFVMAGPIHMKPQRIWTLVKLLSHDGVQKW